MNLRILQPSFAAGELTPALHARVDLNKYAVGAKQLKNFFVHAHGGASNRQGTAFVAAALGATRLEPFQYNVEQSYMLEFSDNRMRVLKDGGLVVHTLDTVSAWGASVEYEVNDFVKNDGNIYRCIGGHTSQADREPGVGAQWTTYWVEDAVLRVTTPYPETVIRELKFVQSADTMFITHPAYPPQTLTRTAHTAWAFATITFAPGIAAPTGLAGSYDGTGSYTISYKVAAVSETGEESLPSAKVDVNADTSGSWEADKHVALSWNAVTGASYYNVYKNTRGYYGFAGTADGTTFKDDNIDPDEEDGPKAHKDPFDGVGKYPGVAGIFQQRMVFGRTDQEPTTIWTSVTGFLNNMSTSRPLKDDDAITAPLASLQVNEVRWLIPFDALVVFTSGGEWLMTNGTNSDALTPTSVQYKTQGYRGCADVKPIVIGETILYVQRGGQVVRDFKYKLETDKYAGENLTVLSEHLFRSAHIVAWGYQQNPHSVVWTVLSDGTFLAFTYLYEHEVWAWAPQQTDGFVEDVAVISGDGEDEVYFVVKRTVGDADVRFIEKLHTRTFEEVSDAFFVDCGLTYDGVAATTISGLEHLIGREVAILADGNVVARRTVSPSGTITLDQEATKVHVGLPYSSTLETLNVDFSSNAGTLQGAKKAIPRVTLRLENTRALFLGSDISHLIEVPFRTDEGYNVATRLFTGDKTVPIRSSWGTDGRVVIHQQDPLPITVLAVIPEVSPGG